MVILIPMFSDWWRSHTSWKYESSPPQLDSTIQKKKRNNQHYFEVVGVYGFDSKWGTQTFSGVSFSVLITIVNHTQKQIVASFLSY